MWTMGVDVIDPDVAATALNSFAFDDLLRFRVSSNVNLTVRTVLASPSRHRPSCEASHPSPSAPHPTPPRTPATPSASKPCGRPTVPSLKLNGFTATDLAAILDTFPVFARNAPLSTPTSSIALPNGSTKPDRPAFPTPGHRRRFILHFNICNVKMHYVESF